MSRYPPAIGRTAGTRCGAAITLCAPVAIVCGVLHAGCLPALDETLRQPPVVDAGDEGHTSLCEHGAPNAVIEGNEECDDGNSNDDDGCSFDCHIDCIGPGLFRWQANQSCYILQSESTTATEAYARCMALGNGAHVLTIRSKEEESAIVSGLLNGLDVTRVILGLRVESDNATWSSMAPGEPGWSAARSCPGCYQRWDDGQPVVDTIRRVAVMSREAGWRWSVESATDRFALVCEREPPGRYQNLCEPEGCNATTYEFAPAFRGGTRYRVQFLPKRFEEAAADCTGWGGSLIDFESEEERALVVRFGPFISFWTGLTRDTEAGTWQWPVADIPWADDTQQQQQGAGALAVTTTFDTNLMQVRSPALALSYLCKKGAP